jgi:hypothetical protein
LNQQTILSRVISDLVNDRTARDEISRAVQRMTRENDAEHKRMSEWEIRRLILQSIIKQNPSITSKDAEALFERRLLAAMKPYDGTRAAKTKGPTARDALRIARSADVKKRRNARR